MKNEMKLIRTIAIAAILATLVGPGGARAENENVDVKALLKRIEELEQKVKVLEGKRSPDAVGELEQKVKILERKGELAEDTAAEKAKAAPSVSIGENGLQVRSADTNFAVALHGVLQVDNRTFFNDGNIQGNDGFLLRRARPVLSGTVYRDFDFLFMPDFGGSTVQIFDAYLNYRYEPWLQLRAGKFKTPVGLEQLQADRDTLFNERSLVTDLVPNRDLGFQLWGDIVGGALLYAVGVFNGVGDARNSSSADFEDHREFAGRLFAQPFKNSQLAALQGFGFGIAGSYGNVFSNSTGLPATTGGTLAGYATDGQQQFFAYNPTDGAVVANGTHWRLSPQASYFYGPFGLLGEYVISNQRVSRTAAPLASANLEHIAWQVTGSWLLTGEDATYGSVTPRHPFDPRNGHWGALQLVGRNAELDIDDDAFPLFANPATSASAAHAWSVGLNWYLNKNVLVKLSYSRTTFSGGGGAGATAPATVTRQPENVLFTRVQLAF
jgi:phosphate-selective porin OprO and OprP